MTLSIINTLSIGALRIMTQHKTIENTTLGIHETFCTAVGHYAECIFMLGVVMLTVFFARDRYAVCH